MHFQAFLESYFQAANAHDVAGTLHHFAADAVVQDEGKEHHGTEEIRRWLEDTNANYNPQSTILNGSASGDLGKAFVSVSGTFPGSPINLTFNFALANGKIQSLTFGEQA
jgi:ketosteroid isomerase-like protein